MLYSSLLLFLLVYFLLSLPFLSSLCLLFPEFIFFSSVNPTCRFQISTFSAYFLFCAPTSKFFWGGGFPHNVQIRPGTRLNPLFVIPTCRFQISTFSAYFLSCAPTSKFSGFPRNVQIRPGTRVVRGPDWASKKQDNGEGFLGTIIFVPKAGSGDNKVTVIWDSGRELRYRAGHDGKYDLLVYDSAPAGKIVINKCRFH